MGSLAESGHPVALQPVYDVRVGPYGLRVRATATDILGETEAWKQATPLLVLVPLI